MPPRDPRVEREQDPLQSGAIESLLTDRESGGGGSLRSTRAQNSSDTIHGATAIGTPPSLTKDAGRRSPSGNGSLHFDSISKYFSLISAGDLLTHDLNSALRKSSSR